MDQGPIDDAPAVNNYDVPTELPSPDAERGEPRRNQGTRNSSRRPGGGTELQPGEIDAFVDGAQESSNAPHHSSLDTSGSLSDPPQYPRVGATAEELRGEKCVDDVGKLKEEIKDKHGRAAAQHRMYRFTLYETTTRYWITGADIADRTHRLLRIDRTSPPGQIGLFEDETTYSSRQLRDVLQSIDEGNKPNGGLKFKCTFWGVLGFIRLTEAYYMLIVTKRQQEALVGGHYIYRIEGTELVPLSTAAPSRFVRDRNPEETRFLGILNNLDLTKSFYFSYSYDITQSLQHNIIRQRRAMNEGRHQADLELNSMFLWNHHLLKPAIAALKHPFDWCVPIIHGFIDQSSLDIFGRTVYITIIGRRSRFFAGARFLKRGVNDQGHVANDVETEQIVSEKLTTSFHAPGPRLYSSPTYTSYLHHRGSIPLFWTQDNSGVSPKPDIDLHLQDPFYQSAALHFDGLFERYGCPVYVLNLIKARERTPRESKLLHAFAKCIDYLNQSLPAESKILYKAFDMSRASKTRGGDVIGSLEVIAKEIVEKTGFFRNGDEVFDEPQVQNGVARTNCIDCLDRTNAAQFVIGKRAFALQLQALGVIDRDEVDFDTDAVNVFTHMFHDHGDTIAVQYGGSHLVNTMATYRKQNQWQSSSRDMVESFKRYYHNSFLDSQRQEAYNLFLGNYVWAQGEPMLWDLATDHYLHHSDPRAWIDHKRRDYISWYTPAFLEMRTLPQHTPNSHLARTEITAFDDYWLECYRPTALSSLNKIFSYRMNTSHRYLPDRPPRDPKHDLSPFKIRLDPHRPSTATDSPDKRSQQPRKGVKILDPHDQSLTDSPRPSTATEPVSKRPQTPASQTPTPTSIPPLSLPPLTQPPHTTAHSPLNSALPATPTDSPPPVQPLDKAQKHLWTLNQFHAQALHPSVSTAETREYARYIAHPLHLPLVVDGTSGTGQRGDGFESDGLAAETETETQRLARGEYGVYLRSGGGGTGSGSGAYNRSYNVSNPAYHTSDPSTPSASTTSLPTHTLAALAEATGEDASESFPLSPHNADHDAVIAVAAGLSEADAQLFREFVVERREGLSVLGEDGGKKRYKAYRQWLLRGKSLFKQSKVDPEFRGVGG